MKKTIRMAAMALSALFCFATTGAYAGGTVTVNDGGVDAANWTAKAGEGDYQALPLEGVTAGATVTVKYDGDKVVQSVKAVKPNPLAVPLTIEAITAGNIVVANPKAGMQYSLNGGDKTAVTSAAIDVAAGDKVQFYGNGTSITQYGSNKAASCTKIAGGTAQVKVYGNIMSLVDETGFATNKTLTATYTFAYLFRVNATLTDASGLLLPAETLSENCYDDMFYGCAALTVAPELPAETLAQSCYTSMFEGCSALTTAPELPAETLAQSCYSSMFWNCSALTTAPALPAETLAKSCYWGMFYGCSALTTAPELKATILAEDCYYNMFEGCSNLASVTCLATDITADDCTGFWLDGVASSGTFTKAAGVDWSGKFDSDGIPDGWTVKEDGESGPSLTTPLTVEAITAGTVRVYMDDELTTGMKYSKNGGDKTTIYNTTDIVVAAGDKVQFYGNGTSTQTYGYWPEVKIQGSGDGFACKVYGNIMSLLDEENFATKTDLPNDKPFVFYGLFQENSSLTDASGLLLPAKTLAQGCYSSMFWGCSALTTAPELPAETLAKSCYANMFRGCIALTTAPELKATILADGCYYRMFWGCSNLASVTCLATDITAGDCTYDWLNGVAASGTFTKAAGVDWSGKTGTSGIPSGWTVKEAAAAEPEVAEPEVTEWDLTSADGKVWTLAEMPEGDVELQVEYEKTYTAKLADSTEDAANWTAKAGEGEFAALPLNGLVSNTVVTVQYGGTKVVKSIKAADIVNIKFEANGNSTIREKVELPHTFWCLSGGKGDFDEILRELYGWEQNQMTACADTLEPEVSDSSKMTARLNGSNHEITIGSAFEGNVTVSGRYFVNNPTMVQYGVTCSIVALQSAPEMTPTANANEWTFTMPGGDVKLSVVYYTDDELAAKDVDALIAAIGAFEPTAAHKEKIDAARAAYDALTAAQKKIVANYATLEASEAAYNAYFLHTVSLADNTVDAANWTAKAGDGDFAALPLKDVESNTVVTVKYDGEKVVKGVKAVKPNPLAVPLTVEALTDGTIKVNMFGGALTTGMKYSKNGGDKSTIYETTNIDVAAGDKVQFYGNGTETQAYGDNPEVRIRGDGEGFTCKVYGNIMSLLDEEGFAAKTDLPNQRYVFYGLFKNNINLTDASGLLLPAETLTSNCYQDMFCACSSLSAAPELKATTLADGCYSYMFDRCSNLASVTCLATDINATYCTSDWLRGVAASGTFTKASGVDWSAGDSGIPGSWTVNEAAAAEPEPTEWELTPTENANEWTFAMPEFDVELQVAYYTDQELADSVTNLIAAIGAFEPTAAHKEKIDAARAAYDALTEGQQALVSNYDVLEAAEAAYNAYFHTVSLAGGTEDIENWTAKAGEGDFAALPLKDVTSNTVVTVQYGGEKVVKSVKAVDPKLAVPMTIEALTAGTIKVNIGYGVGTLTTGMKYSKNGGEKTTIYNTTDIVVAEGDTVQFYGNGTSTQVYGGVSPVGILGDGAGFTCKVYGNIMSLVDETGFATNKTLTANKTFTHLFRQNNTLTDASDLLLPAETLAENCYASMFMNCVALTTAPALPAKTLAKNCYDCMFYNCQSLTVAPELKATTLVSSCYRYMFRNCGKLNSVTCLATDIDADSCTQSWLQDVAGSGTFTKAAGVDWSGKTGYNGIPSGWTVEEAAAAEPEPAPADIELTPTENANEWTFAMPEFDVELQVAYYTEDELAALAVDALIADIGEVAYTAESKALVDAARAAYDALTAAQKALVTNYDVLVQAEADCNSYFHDVALADGTEDAANWTAKAGEGDLAALPLNDLVSNTVVTVQYGGEKVVKSIAAAAADKEITILHSDVPNGSQNNFEKNGIRLAFTNGAVYNEYITAFEDSEMSVSSTVGNITKVTITCADANYGPSGFHRRTGTWSCVGLVGTWTGDDNSLSLDTSGDVRITSIVVTVKTDNEVTLTPTENDNEWTFTMPADDVNLKVVYYTEDELAAMAVDALIEAIGEVAYTEESKALIDAAREAYDALTGDQKALVADYAALETAETTYAAAEDAAFTAGVELTDNGDGTWTLDATPALNINLLITYYTDDEVAALDVEALIAAIGEVAYTTACKTAIDAAREAYDALTDGQKDLVANYETLTAAEVDYAIAAIAAIGEVAYTSESKALIDAAREAYDALTADQKDLVANYETLTTAEASYADMDAAAGVDALIAAIGEVAYNETSEGLITAAREAYDALTDDQKALVTSYETLTTAETAYTRAVFEAQLSSDLAAVADKVEALAEASEGIEAITNLIAEINGYTVVDVAGTVFEQIMASAEQVEVNDEIKAGLKAVLGMTDDEIAALPYVLVADPFAFLTGKKVGLAYGTHGYTLGAASAADICEITYTGSKGNEYTIVADASDEEAARHFSFRMAGSAIPVAVKLPASIALTLVKNGEETLTASLDLQGADGKTYQVFRDDEYALDFSLSGTVKGKEIEFTASLDHEADRSYELDTLLKVDGESVIGIHAEGDNTPYDEETLGTYMGVLEGAGGVWSALGKVLGFVNGQDLDYLEVTIRDNIVIEGSVKDIGGMLAGAAKIVGGGEVSDAAIDAITAALNANVSYTVTQKNTGITAEGSFVAGISPTFKKYMPLIALRFEGEDEAQAIASRFTEGDWANVARIMQVAAKALEDVSAIVATVVEKVAETKQQIADAAAADAVTAAIDAIGTVEYTETSKAKIDAARAAYDALTDAQKALVTNYTTLTAAEAAYAALKAAAEAGDAEPAKVIDVPVIEGGADLTNVTVQAGQPYTDEVIEQITKVAQSAATRHGQVVIGWVNADGSAVTGATIASTDDRLTAVWDTVNPLVPETLGEGAVNNAKTVTYDAYVLDASGNAYGTVKVTVGKENKGLSFVKAVVNPYTGGSKTFRATEAKGKATISDKAASTVKLASKKDVMTLVIGTAGVEGLCTIAGVDYEINGSLNVVKNDKSAYDVWKGARTAALVDGSGATFATFSISVKARGKVSVKGYLANGKKVSSTAQLMLTDNNTEACVAIKGTKKLPFSAVVWFGRDGAVAVESIKTSLADGVTSQVAGNAGDISVGEHGFTIGTDETIPLTFDGKKFTSTAGVKMKYTASTGEFSGSYKESNTSDGGKTKKRTIKFKGVFVDGIGYGVVTSNDPALRRPVTVK